MKFKIGEKTYEFKMTNNTVFEIDRKYGNYGEVVNGLMQGVNLYNNALILVSCSCIDTMKVFNKNTREYDEVQEELSREVLIEKLTPEQIESQLVNFAIDLYFEYKGLNKKAKNNKENGQDVKKK